MQNPFESGQIKNYLLFYAGVILIVVLFFIASTLFLKQDEIKQKKFTNEKYEKVTKRTEENATEKKAPLKRKFKLLKSVY